ncbi:hypothetical protein GOBAR_AA24025 [Gossypium barbadense]|uniref:Transposase MuDR plant domain-containing protein n=1 Tax=Gossypium barbadense TaxID=3634 RepID=A0A2P5WZX1_GOSBA|nr:hypothetical protein GOBAR_AA24025 [Gossypium barbadense]
MVALYCQDQSHQTDLIQLFDKAFVDRRSTVHGIDIDLNAQLASENLNLGLYLQIHLIVIETSADGDDGFDNNDHFDHEIEDYKGPDLEKVLDDVDDECVNDDENVIVAYMSIIDLDAAHASEFLKYPDLLSTYRLVANFECEELLMGQEIATKKVCIFVIKRYSMNVSVDYKVVVFKPALYIGEC